MWKFLNNGEIGDREDVALDKSVENIIVREGHTQ